MRIIVQMSTDEVKKFIKNKKITGIETFEMTNPFRRIVSRELKSYTGLGNHANVGLTLVNSRDKLDDVWSDLTGLLNFKVNDFLLEFNIPKDSIITMSLEDFLMNNVEDLDKSDLTSVISKGVHGANVDNEIGVVPILLPKYLKKFMCITDTWDYKEQKIKKGMDLSKIKIFKEA